MHLVSAKRFLFFIPFSILLLSLAFLGDASEIFKEKLKDASRLIEDGLYREAECILRSLKDRSEALFLLGRLYKEEGSFEEAEEFLRKTIEAYPLLKDYALISLAELYLSYGHFGKAIETVRTVKNPLLKQDAKKLEFNALIAMEKEKEAIDVLSQYINEYPEDIESKFLLATLYKKNRINEAAIRLFKDIYINASDLAEDALIELKELKADVFTKEELLLRADNLFKNYDYRTAKTTYEEALELVNDKLKEKVRFAIGMCQFRLKQYVEAAKSFKRVKGSEALYWQARALFRVDDREGFDSIMKEFEKNYPRDKLFASLLLMSADDFRRKGDLKNAEREYARFLKIFPKESEDALWGLGWMYYSTGEYDKALKYFSRLTTHINSRAYYKYLYWRTRVYEKLTEDCIKKNTKHEEGFKVCTRDDEFSSSLSYDDSYYGYLIRFRFSDNKSSARPQVNIPIKPNGEVYERIEALALLGMKDWAIREIKDALSMIDKKEEFLYLGHLAKEMGEYKTIIALTENKKGEEFLTLSYPLGYWDTVKSIAEKEGLDPYLIAAVIREESRFDPTAVSWAGAIGLMQLMPTTAGRFSDLFDPQGGVDTLQDVRRNILLGARYLSILIKEFKVLPYALIAYNAGENALMRWLDSLNDKDIDEFIEDIPYAETKRYVMKVLKSYWQYRSLHGLPIDGF